MENVMVAKKWLLVIAAALVLALAVSTSVLDPAHAKRNMYEYCENPNEVHPEYCVGNSDM